MTDTKRIHHKYDVRRTDGSTEAGGQHHGCTYFVIDLGCDEFAIPALKAYARACAKDKPELARDLRAMIAAQLEDDRRRCGCREASCPHSLGQAFSKNAAETAEELMAHNPLEPK